MKKFESFMLGCLTLKAGDTVRHKIWNSQLWTKRRVIDFISRNASCDMIVHYKDGVHDKFITILTSWLDGTTQINPPEKEIKDMNTIKKDGITLCSGDVIHISGKLHTISQFEPAFNGVLITGSNGMICDFNALIAKFKAGSAYIVSRVGMRPVKTIDKVKADSNFPILVQDVNTGKYMVLMTSNGLLCGSTVKVIETSIAIIML
jgi:hypothetical protein